MVSILEAINTIEILLKQIYLFIYLFMYLFCLFIFLSIIFIYLILFNVDFFHFTMKQLYKESNVSKI